MNEGEVKEPKEPVNNVKPMFDNAGPKPKLDYAQLEQVAIQATQQAKKFYAELQQANYSNALNRMGMLFEVIHASDKFDTEFVNLCAEEIKKFLTLEPVEVTDIPLV